jgi:hypothetical protein
MVLKLNTLSLLVVELVVAIAAAVAARAVY